ncbi:MAG: RDD family protein [Pseudomonadota bacterium]
MQYAGFWKRVLAVIIDSILILCITMPLLGFVYGWGYFADTSRGFIPGGAEFLISYVLPALATIAFWKTRQATPGKMALSLKIVDAETGMPISTGQAIGRYFAYFLSAIVFMLGYLWVAFDSRKQAWHDKLAGTVVITRH